MELHDALVQIDTIRAQVARTETFRGYRAVTVGSTGLLALAAAAVQSLWLPDPLADTAGYLRLWVSVAAASLAMVAAELVVRWYRTDSLWAREQTWRAIEQFAPCVIAGGALTGALARWVPDSVRLLPGVWAVVFSLGIFASARQLPRAVLLAGAYYLIAGLSCIVVANGDAALSPWGMAGAFGVGQLLTASILYWTLERPHAQG